MPLTFSHPAAAAPLARFGLPLSALVVGSMTPDFPYFMSVSTHSHYGHTLQGLFLFCLPAGFLALWTYHVVLKLPLLALLSPSEHRARLAGAMGRFRFLPLSRFLRIHLALLLGAITHVVWDSFTHGKGWTVQHIPALAKSIAHTSRGDLCVYNLLQHGSTILGAGLLIYWYMRWYRKADAAPGILPFELQPRIGGRLFAAVALIAAMAGIARGIAIGLGPWRANGIQASAFGCVVVATATLFFELLVYSFVWHACAGRRGRKQSN